MLVVASLAVGACRNGAEQSRSDDADSAPVDRAPATAPPKCRVEGPLWGVHQDLGYEGDADRRSRSIELAAGQLHAQVSRNSLLWDEIERRPARRDWSRYDHIVDELRARGVETLFVLVGSPSWVNGSPDRFSVPSEEHRFAEWVTRYAEFARAAAVRYRGRVRWEIWNEPNNQSFWKPTPSVDRYAVLFNAVRNALRVADPTAPIAVGGINNLAVAPAPDLPGLEFLRGLHDRGVDLRTVAIHPYASAHRGPDTHVPGQNNVGDVRATVALLRSLGQADPELWVTELGWDRMKLGDARQAEYVNQALVLLRDHYPQVTLTVVFIDRDRPLYSYGLATADGRLAPAGEAFARFAASAPRALCP